MGVKQVLGKLAKAGAVAAGKAAARKAEELLRRGEARDDVRSMPGLPKGKKEPKQ